MGEAEGGASTWFRSFCRETHARSELSSDVDCRDLEGCAGHTVVSVDDE
jgi:hypothetical protein